MIDFKDIDACVIKAMGGFPYVEELALLYEEVEEYVNVRINYYRFLYQLVLMQKPLVVLELGVEYGIASAYMCAAAATYGGRVIGIDHQTRDIPRFKIAKYYKNYAYVVGDTIKMYEVVKHLAESFTGVRQSVGLVFQDSSHHYLPSVHEWNLYTKLMPKNESIWVCDDISEAFKTPHETKGMIGYFQERPGNKKLYPELYNNEGNNIGVVLL